MSKRYTDVVCIDAQPNHGGDGSPYIELTLKALTGEDAGRNFRKRCYLTEKTTARTQEQLRALGWTGTLLSKAMSEGLGTLKASALIGDDINKQTGKVYKDSVLGIYAIEAKRSATAVDADSMAAFDALFSESAANVPVVAKTALNTPPEKLPEPVAKAAKSVDADVDF